ncbi:hydroxymethylbilane synthase [Campylobacter sp. MIT 21-1685]|uniref:hydroxymethylbilane synthase n=1 Tax=unclassified Campylobacter TaxID=2593542 RepID=UPI00224B3E11|nr:MULTISPECIES: hydroxymethylbilane synthase [unclassified Campylobacter]MCX2682914.1 hydroxymethylbilane synthase [Campylobacter sp. MIT 21-1684]MCX2751138.1 hydroxymethylbilane synthase [Campylobacter sp. MIT 21-1682]MCX2807395.1 hydroxymethylbilane synthase [Campylobacter sp. MIT 21-1685]
MQKLIIATRKSALAVWQSEFIKKELLQKYPHLEISVEGFTTKGDVLLDSPLAKIGGKGLFTKELEEAILRKEAHLAVHSLKDVPSFFPQGLKLAAVTQREMSEDVMLSQKYKDFQDLPQGARVGTTSLRRRMQVLALRSDLKIISLRGNVNSRISKLKNGDFDAIILARAGIERLALHNEVRFVFVFSKDEMIPAASQGALGIESRDDREILSLLDFLNDEKTLIETTIERDFIRVLEGGCQVPLGVNAELNADTICVRAVLGLPDASEMMREKRFIPKEDFLTFGEKFAKEFLAQGAKELLNKAQNMI